MKDFGKSIGGGRRAAARVPAPVRVLFTTTRASQSAILKDISSTGALLCATHQLQKGEDLLLSIDTFRLFGTVVRVGLREFAIAFDEPLCATKEQEIRQRAQPAAGLSPELKIALDDWTQGLAR